MEVNMPKIAAVSLMIDYEYIGDKRLLKSCKNNNSEALKIFVKNRAKQRIKEIIKNIEWAQKNKADILVFPGWTVAEPNDLATVAKHVNKNIHVIIELMNGANEFRNKMNINKNRYSPENFMNDSAIFILNNHEVEFGPIFQTFAIGPEVYEYPDVLENGVLRQLKSELQNTVFWDNRDADDFRGAGQGRWLDLGNKGRYLILICGETNLMNDKSYNWHKASKDLNFHNIDYKSATAILNPAHTPSSKYMDEKRKIWSKLTNVPLIHCANINKQLRNSKDEVKINAAFDGTQICINGDIFKLLKYKNQDDTLLKEFFCKNKKIYVSNSDVYQRALIDL
jgi:hypothetical protein